MALWTHFGGQLDVDQTYIVALKNGLVTCVNTQMPSILRPGLCKVQRSAFYQARWELIGGFAQVEP